MIKLMLITNNPEVAILATSSGVDRIFVDLEVLGKQERQGHLNTVRNNHSISDVQKIRAAVPQSELLVRLNPYHDQTETEIEQAIDAGADLLMLPMFSSADEIRHFCEMVNHRVGVVPLLETPEAMYSLPQWVNTNGISEIYIGLNDLHLGLKLDFMFQPLADGLVDSMASIIKTAGLPFGFGGIARMEEGVLQGKVVLGEHVRLGSSSVILSRTFNRYCEKADEFQMHVNFKSEIAKLRQIEKKLAERDFESIEQNKENMIQIVKNIVKGVQ